MRKYEVNNLAELKRAVLRLKDDDRLYLMTQPTKQFPGIIKLQISIKATERGIFLRTFKGFASGATAKLDRRHSR